MANAPYRVQNDLGFDATVRWLEDWFGHENEIIVEPLVLASPTAAQTSERGGRFDQLRSGNQSELHSYLKLAAWNWLEANSSHPDTLAAEVSCYEPPEKTNDGWRSYDGLGLEIDIYSPQIIYKGWNGFPVSYGKRVIVDLHSFDYAVEVGATQPVNLLLPLTAGLADRSLWVPYPRMIKADGLRQLLARSEPLQAYTIRLAKPSRMRRYRTPAKNARGPHPYPLNQWALVDWYIRKHGNQAPRHAESNATKMMLAFEPDAARNWLLIAGQIRDALAEQRVA